MLHLAHLRDRALRWRKASHVWRKSNCTSHAHKTCQWRRAIDRPGERRTIDAVRWIELNLPADAHFRRARHPSAPSPFAMPTSRLLENGFTLMTRASPLRKVKAKFVSNGYMRRRVACEMSVA
jgi:hypothetical protein